MLIHYFLQYKKGELYIIIIWLKNQICPYDNRRHTDAIVVNSFPHVAITTAVYVLLSTVKAKNSILVSN